MTTKRDDVMLYEVYLGKIFGIVYEDMPCTWDTNGKCFDTMGEPLGDKHSLTPIKSPWYKDENLIFPCVVMFLDGHHHPEILYERAKNMSNYRLATKAEVDSLYYLDKGKN